MTDDPGAPVQDADDIHAERAIANMRAPGLGSNICLDVTNKCDLRCSNCTRLLRNQSELWDMTPDNFRLALKNLRSFRGVIAMIGGNPCMHKEFPELCRIFVEEIPEKHRRGLWSNNLFNYQELIRDCFGHFNLNPHNMRRGIESIVRLQAMVRGIGHYHGHSMHSPVLTAVRDLYPDPQEMWGVIEKCDINREWSAAVIQNKGNLRVYFCEIAASLDLARDEDHGLPLSDHWWDRPITDFASQIKHFCPGCGVSARLEGHRDDQETDTYTPSNALIAEKAVKRGKRQIIEIKSIAEAIQASRHFTQYNDPCVEQPAPPAAADAGGKPTPAVVTAQAAQGEDFASNIWVINLDRTPDRYQRFRQYNDAFIGHRRLPAIDGTNVSRDELAARNILAPPVPYSPGGVGNLLSHLSLWEHCIREDRVVTVCEDDAIFNHQFQNITNILYGLCKGLFDIVYWGWNFDSPVKFDLLPGGNPTVLHADQTTLRQSVDNFRSGNIASSLYRLHELYGVICYSISPRGARKIISNLFPIQQQNVFSSAMNRPVGNHAVDVSLNALHPRLDSLLCLPPLVATINDVSKSTVTPPERQILHKTSTFILT